MAMCVSAILLIALGLLSVYGKDIMWELTERQNRLKGLASERTPAWDNATTIGGVMALVIDVIALVLSFSIK
jgi:hypothetical protein